MITHIEAETPLELYKKILDFYLHDGDKNTVITDNRNMARYWNHDIVCTVKKAYPNDFDLALTGYTFPQRWGKFIAEYTDPQGFADFLAKTVSSAPWQQSGYSTPIVAQHNLGNCLIGLSARRGSPRQRPSVSLLSRSTMMFPTGGLDIGFGAAIAKALVDLGLPEDMSLTWHVSMMQVVSWKMVLSMALLGMVPDNFEDLPNTKMGNRIKEHLYDSMLGNVPKLRMFARQGIKFKRLKETGQIGRALQSFYPYIPPSHLPIMGKGRALAPALEVDEDLLED